VTKAELARFIAEREAAQTRRKALLARPISRERTQAQIFKRQLIAEHDEKRRALNAARGLAGGR
jgi:hypothetical protein